MASTIANGNIGLVALLRANLAASSALLATLLGSGGTIASPQAVIYDTTIGLSVDANGFTSLPLRPGANRYFVGAGGSDANTGLSHAQRLATFSAAWQKMVSGQGDQLLIAEGTTLAETLPQGGDAHGWLGDKPGFSPLYPTVFSSYDPADPTNEAKYGMGHQRNARPILTAFLNGGNGAPAYMAIKGLVLNAGNVTGQGLNFVGSALKYVLLENNIFAYTAISFTDAGDGVAAAIAQHIIIRNNSSYGVWTNSSAHVGNVYVDGVNGLTYEDNVNYHSGWKIGGGVTRDTDPTLGGPDVFRHPYYFQANTNNVIVRRNLIMDGAADGGISRGNNALIEENVTLHCPAGTGLGPGNTAEFGAFPAGVLIEARYNFSSEAVNLNSTNPSGYGYTLSNMAPGSRVHHNLLIYSAATSGNNDVTVATTGGTAYGAPTQHTYTEFEFNRAYHWSASGNSAIETSTPIHSLYSDNVWDSPPSGSNVNWSSVTFANAYTEAALLAAAGVTDYNTLVSLAIAAPEQHYQRTIRQLAFAGYGLAVSAGAEADQTAPTLSAPSAAATGTGTATVGASTTEASGRLYAILSTSATPPHVSQIKMGLLADGSAAPKAATATVSSSGAQSINLTGIPTGTYYAHLVHEDASGNKSAAASTSGSISVTGVTYATLNPADKSANVTLSNGNLTGLATGATPSGVRATKALTAKAYWEVHLDVEASDIVGAIVGNTATLGSPIWWQTNSTEIFSWGDGYGQYHGTSASYSSAGGTQRWAYDPATKKAWIGNSTGWLNGDPVAGTGGMDLSAMTGTPYPAFQGDSNDKATFNFGATAYVYTPPAGFGNV